MIMSMLWAGALVLTAQAKEVVAPKADEAPVVDGDPGDQAWGAAEWTEIETMRTDNPVKPGAFVKIKAVYTKDEVFLLARWGDETHDTQHKPYRYNDPPGRYFQDERILEDQFTIGFPIDVKKGFLGDMLRMDQASWDVWQWGASRTPDGFARDRLHEYTAKEPKTLAAGATKKEFQERATNKKMWIIRSDDKGTQPLKDVAKPAKEGEKLVASTVPQKPAGSAADVRAKGVWTEGVWVLEIGRKLDTTDAKGDVKFDVKKPIDFAIGVFDHDKEDVHSTSKVMKLTWK